MARAPAQPTKPPKPGAKRAPQATQGAPGARRAGGPPQGAQPGAKTAPRAAKRGAAAPPPDGDNDEFDLSKFIVDVSGASSLPIELSEDDSSWVRGSGKTPLEFLVYTYRNPWIKPSDRISAAKAVLEYAHKRLPNELKLKGDLTTTRAAPDLSMLSDEELSVFTALLEKMNKGSEG